MGNAKQEAILKRVAERKASATQDSAVPSTRAEIREPAVEPKRAGPLGRRIESMSKLNAQPKETVAHYRCPTAKIRLWKEHNRHYDTLNTENCADLIDGFQRAGGQQFAAVVRKVTDSDQYDYEVICGARRHWTASYLEVDLLIDVRTLTDRQAFILQDLENRDRQDISDYERALDYRNALAKYFDNDQTAMAKHLQLNRVLFRRLLSLTELPETVVEAYRDKHGLKAHHADPILKLLAEPKSRRLVLDRAKRIRQQQKEDGKSLEGAKVFAFLKITEHQKSAQPIRRGQVTLANRTKNTLKLEIDIQKGDIKKIETDISELLRQVLAKENA